MFDWLVKLFRFFIPDFNTREVERLSKVVTDIHGLEEETKKLSDDALRDSTVAFRQRLLAGETIDDIKAEVFAVVRETSIRQLGMRHFDVQMLGGLALHEGRIVEMKTGEGKTLVATLPVVLNALDLNPDWVDLAQQTGILNEQGTNARNFAPIVDRYGRVIPPGKGVHVVTVNDYLARRDSEWMGRIYKALGLSVGLNVHGLDADEKREAYNADITYGTNNEFGFDYLRDNMALRLADCVQRRFNYAIVDEVDSILIDEARTPLIISGPAEKATGLYYIFAKVARETMRVGEHYTIDEKHHGVSVNEDGVAAVEKVLGVENLYAQKNMELVHHMQNALKAKHFFKRDDQYMVRDREDGKPGKEVVIVDEFTGRLMFGRRYSDGMHQAIEAKENVTIQQENQTLASITFQNYFRLYSKLSGMTGTAETEAKEFNEIYKCQVVVIPPNRPCTRADQADCVMKTFREKFNRVVDHIVEIHQKGQPMLVGTVSIEKSEVLAELLRKRGVECQVLNARYHEREAEIIAQAGREGAITIATNMAGRGTDILLGGNPEMLAAREAGAREGPEYDAALKKFRELCAAEKERVIAAGGLCVIGTERHEARRIDNQLRGRSGRQGDPGESTFYLSLEDDLMRLFGSDNIAGWMEKLGWEENEPIEHPWITRAIENAQRRVESHHFSMRKHVLKYDDVMNEQRKLIYAERRKALEMDDIHEYVLGMIETVLDEILERIMNPQIDPDEWDYEAMAEQVKKVFPIEVTADELRKMSQDEIKEKLQGAAEAAMAAKEAQIGKENFHALEKFVLLQIVDSKWKDHLHNMDVLQDGIHLRSYGQKDPLVEYKIEGFSMFDEMNRGIQEEILYFLYRTDYSSPAEEEHEQVAEQRQQELSYNRGADGSADDAPKAPTRAKGETGRNDPCPCGSGKKYKKCCGMNA